MPELIAMDRLLSKDVGNLSNLKPNDRDMFGVEVELEGRSIKNIMSKYWVMHEDHSLRTLKPNSECCEYVLLRPLCLEDTHVALKELFNYLNTTPYVEVFDSYRTSIHIHVNCLFETTRTIVNYITLAIIFDELFVSQNGETRVGNNFCLRTRDAEGQIADLVSSIKNTNSLMYLTQNNRYSATNFSSLLKFGTIEFRSLECTTNISRVMHWIETLQALKVSAREYENPKEIIAQFSRMGLLKFVRHNLKDCATKYLSVPGASNMLMNGMRLAQDFAYCCDWIPAPPAAEKPKRSRTTKSPLDAYIYGEIAAMAQINPNPFPWNAHIEVIDE